MAFTTLPATASLKPTQFTVNIPDAELSDLKAAIKSSRLGPPTYENQQEDRRFGVTRHWLQETRDYWVGKFDWREQEKRMNTLPNYKVDIKDDDDETYSMHFVAFFSENKDAVPLLLVHGWPGSFLEFLPMLHLLSQKYPDASQLPYHVIVPSVPGCAFSSGPPLHKDFTVFDQARILHKLMVGLGFEKSGYVSQGGDTGAIISRILGQKEEACRAYHINLISIPEPAGVGIDQVNDAEREGLKVASWFNNNGDGYAREHGTRPSTVGLAISSSPLALLAWIGEKFLEWTDEDPSVDDILESVSLYWFTDTYPRHLYHYRTLYGPDAINPFVETYSNKPFGYSWFPKEIQPMPKAWVAAAGNLVWHRQHTHGGHFAAMERPVTLLEDIEDFIAHVWPVKSTI